MSSHIQTYLQSIATQLQTGNATEHTHRPALQNLLTALLPDYRITNEPRRIACGSPDFEIAKGEEPIGHIEAKDVGVNLEKVQHSEQLKRYLPSLNNLLLTDYLEFRWFVNAEYQPAMTVKLAEVDKTGKLRPILENFARFDTLLKTFVETPVITLRSPEELAKKMAHLARLMRDVMLKAYQQEEKTGQLHGQLESFRQVLIDTLMPEQFTDMLAQTICYGLFAAKCSVVGGQPFSRQNASHFVPKTNPFLRSLFNQIAGIELDDRLVWMVDHLIAVLNRVDMAAILENFGKRTRQEDPVVHFYETFLAHYDAKLREVRGVYYTPEPVVSSIVRSVDWVLTEKFGLKQGLADNTQLENNLHKVQILDPATGTGTFLHAVVAKIYERFRKNQGMWSDYVAKHLLPRVHGFELLIAPYTVAHLKLSLQLQATGYDFRSEERLRVFLTNTLDEPHQSETTWLAIRLSDEANAASGIKQHSPVMVILGNPPYSYDSMNKGEWIGKLVRDYYQLDGQPLKERNPKGLQDDYVKFIRFAQWRIEQTGYGILAFVTNHGYLDNPTFCGMRQSLMQEFDDIYILDLHGNSKKKEKSPDGSIDQNVFDIQQGVAIGIFVKHQRKDLTGLEDLSGLAKVHHAHLYGTRASKYEYLMENDLKTTSWTTLQPHSPFYLLVPQNVDLLAEYEQGWKVTEMMTVNSVGIVTARDNLTIHYTQLSLLDTLRQFGQLETEQARHQYELGKDARDWKVSLAQQDIQEHGIVDQYLQPLLYRPFDTRYTYYTGKTRGFHCMPRLEVMQHLLQGGNVGLTVGRAGQAVGSEQWDIVFCADTITDMNLFRRGGNNLFPLYLYPTEKTGLFASPQPNTARKPNFSESFINDLETRLHLQLIPEGHGNFKKTVSALDVFNYMYAIFHSPTYRQRYAEFLKIDFPRLPLTSDQQLFKSLTELGGQLVKIHLMEAEIENDCSFPINGHNLVEKLVYKEEKVYINKTQYFDHVTPDIWEFHIGGYQVGEKWLKDRKGRVLSFEECSQYLYILAAIEKTRELMERIDETIPNFPI
jgi:predicted helicase